MPLFSMSKDQERLRRSELEEERIAALSRAEEFIRTHEPFLLGAKADSSEASLWRDRLAFAQGQFKKHQDPKWVDKEIAREKRDLISERVHIGAFGLLLGGITAVIVGAGCEGCKEEHQAKNPDPAGANVYGSPTARRLDADRAAATADVSHPLRPHTATLKDTLIVKSTNADLLIGDESIIHAQRNSLAEGRPAVVHFYWHGDALMANGRQVPSTILNTNLNRSELPLNQSEEAANENQLSMNDDFANSSLPKPEFAVIFYVYDAPANIESRKEVEARTTISQIIGLIRANSDVIIAA